jgi:hypothetical protein
MADLPDCRHLRKRLIAKDKDAEYVECLDCGAILEAEELAAAPQAESPGDAPAFPESLSDA